MSAILIQTLILCNYLKICLQNRFMFVINEKMHLHYIFSCLLIKSD